MLNGTIDGDSRIIVWAHGSLPEWQSDLVRRYLESGSILKDDIDEIYPAVLTNDAVLSCLTITTTAFAET